MTTQSLTEVNFYKTADLALAAVLSLTYPLEAIEHDAIPRKAYFVFLREPDLDAIVEDYWQGKYAVEPREYFNALRMLKTRLYERQQ